MEKFFKELMRNNFEPRFLDSAKILQTRAKIFQKVHHTHTLSESMIKVCDPARRKKMDLGGRRGFQ